jgi:hypothetical protein
MSARRLFILACVAAALAIAAYAAFVSPAFGPGRRATGRSSTSITVPVTQMPEGPSLLFSEVEGGDAFGRLALVRLPLPASSSPPRLITPLSCRRLHYAHGWGVCLASDESALPVRHTAFVFDREFRRGQTLDLTGPPIRARVSPDGRRAAMTVFASGHSYADGTFSTRTTIVDTHEGRVLIPDLEALSVLKDDAPFKRADFNFWGVSFEADGDHFYATLKTEDQRYLIRGSIDARNARVVRPDVECPSLSPDGRRIVFKKPLGTGVGWRLHVLDLATGHERPLDQIAHSVDDQVDWFDAGRIVYHDGSDAGAGIWMLDVDGAAPPTLLLPGAYSPAVQP